MTEAKAPQPSTQVNFDVPAGACDCHNHILGRQDQFPLIPPAGLHFNSR
jgi:hypothetical protein